MANLRFNVKVYLENAGVLPELQARMADLSPFFEAVYQRWVDVNAQKFEQSRGAETTGAFIFDEFWQSLSSGYIKEKHPSGAPRRRRKSSGEYPDWLMVRTGALMEAMTDPTALFNAIGPEQATFGTPNDPELADIVRWQSGERQKHRDIVFLAEPDMNSIRMNLQDYLGMGGDFQALRFAAGMQAQALEEEKEAMEAQFQFDAAGI